MPVVRGPDGSLELQTNDGIRVPWMLPEADLAGLGQDIPPPPGLSLGERGATAFNVIPTEKSLSEFQSEKPDAVGAIPGLAAALGKPPEQPKEDIAPEDDPFKYARQREELGAKIDRARAPAAAPLRGGGERTDIQTEGRQGQAPTAPAARNILVKGGPRLASFNIQKGAENVPALAAAEDESARADIRAIEANEQFQYDQRKQQAHLLDGEIARQGAVAEGLRKKNDGIRTEITNRMLEIEKERDEANALESFEPNYWADKSTPAKIISAISLIAGGIRAGISGGRNQALDRMDRIIEAEKARHRSIYEARRNGAQLKMTELERFMDRMDPDLAEKELEIRLRDMLDLKMQKFALDTGDPQLIAETNAAIQSRRVQSEKNKAEFAQGLGDRVAESWVNVPDRVVTVGEQAPLKPEQRERQVRFNGGNSVGFVVAGNARDKVQTAISGFQNLSSGFAKLASIAANSAGPGDLAAQRAYDSLRDTLMAEKSVQQGQGNMSEGAAAQMEASMPDFAKAMTSKANVATRLEQQSQWAASRLESTIRDNVYTDPDATTPAVSGAPRSFRHE